MSAVSEAAVLGKSMELYFLTGRDNSLTWR